MVKTFEEFDFVDYNVGWTPYGGPPGSVAGNLPRVRRIFKEDTRPRFQIGDRVVCNYLSGYKLNGVKGVVVNFGSQWDEKNYEVYVEVDRDTILNMPKWQTIRIKSDDIEEGKMILILNNRMLDSLDDYEKTNYEEWVEEAKLVKLDKIEIGDTVFVKHGKYKGKIGKTVSTSQVWDEDFYLYMKAFNVSFRDGTFGVVEDWRLKKIDELEQSNMEEWVEESNFYKLYVGDLVKAVKLKTTAGWCPDDRHPIWKHIGKIGKIVEIVYIAEDEPDMYRVEFKDGFTYTFFKEELSLLDEGEDSNMEEWVEESMITKFNQFILEDVTQFKQGNFDVLYRDNNLTVFVPKSFEACLISTRNTQWCTKNKSMYKEHTEKGDILFRFFFKDGYKLRLTINSIKHNNEYSGHWGEGSIQYKNFQLGWYNMSKDPFNYQGGLDYLDKNKKKPNLEEIRRNYLETNQRRIDFHTQNKNTEMLQHYNTTPEENEKEILKRYSQEMNDYKSRYKMLTKISQIPEEAKQKVLEYLHLRGEEMGTSINEVKKLYLSIRKKIKKIFDSYGLKFEYFTWGRESTRVMYLSIKFIDRVDYEVQEKLKKSLEDLLSNYDNLDISDSFQYYLDISFDIPPANKVVEPQKQLEYA